MFWIICLAILMSSAVPMSRNVQQGTVMRSQNSALTQQIVLLIALIKQYALQTPFTQDTVVALSLIDPQSLLSQEWLQNEVDIYRTISGFFIHIRAPKNQWAVNFIEETSLLFYTTPSSSGSAIYPSCGTFLPYVVGKITDNGLEPVGSFAAGLSELQALSLPKALVAGSLVVWIH